MVFSLNPAGVYVCGTVLLGAAAGYLDAALETRPSVIAKHRRSCDHNSNDHYLRSVGRCGACDRQFPDIVLPKVFFGACLGPLAIPLAVLYAPAAIIHRLDQRKLDAKKAKVVAPSCSNCQQQQITPK